jgi:hypothetical protein
MIGDIPMDEGLKKIATLIRAADVIHTEMEKEAATEASLDPIEKEAAGLLGGIRTGLSHFGRNVGTGAKDLASQIARSRAGLPIAGGVAGAGVATPFALEEFGEGDVPGGIAALLAGAGVGTGAGFLGRDLSKLHKAVGDFGGLSKYEKIMASLKGTV